MNSAIFRSSLFSNDISLRENNIWLLGFSPEEQVESVISCALSHGYKNFQSIQLGMQLGIQPKLMV